MTARNVFLILGALMCLTAAPLKAQNDAAATGDLVEHFRVSGKSTDHLTHGMWGQILKFGVYTRDDLKIRDAEVAAPPLGSRIATTSSSGVALSANRVPFAMLSGPYKDGIDTYLQGMQMVPITTLQPDDQLAYWLNVHNALTFQMILRRYPKVNLKALSEDATASSALTEKTFKVDGRQLSILDVRHIVTGRWQDPKVIYGLWLAAEGGPSLSKQPFRHDTVWPMLETEFRKFVDSGRAVRKASGGLRISEVYRIHGDLFPGGDADIISHLKGYSGRKSLNLPTPGTKLGSTFFDWTLVDHKPRTDSYESLRNMGTIITDQGNTP